MIFFSLLSFGQRTVSGVVTDEKNGEALIGVNVIVSGTSYGTTTNIDGKYTLNLLDNQNQLEFSYVGYETQTIDMTANKSNVMNLALKEGSILDEVVVIGYGTSKKRNVADAIATINSKDFNKGVIASPEQLIQGKVAGVQIDASVRADGSTKFGANNRYASNPNLQQNPGY